jgi:hypothetical protein
MKPRMVVGASLAIALSMGALIAAETLKSGPQPGQNVPGPFNVLNINGSAAGSSNCQV